MGVRGGSWQIIIVVSVKGQDVLPWHAALLCAIVCSYGLNVRTMCEDIALMTDRGPGVASVLD